MRAAILCRCRMHRALINDHVHEGQHWWCNNHRGTDGVAGVERKVELLREVKENIEVTLTGDYDHFLAAMVPPLLAALTSTQPQSANTPVQQLRHTALEILRRLPANQVPLPVAFCTPGSPATLSVLSTCTWSTHSPYMAHMDVTHCSELRQTVCLVCSCCSSTCATSWRR